MQITNSLDVGTIDSNKGGEVRRENYACQGLFH